MRYLSSLTLILALSQPALSQDKTFVDVIVTHRYLDCRDVEFNALSIIEQLYKANEIDSLYRFIDYWGTKCGTNEQPFRLARILDIKTNNFNPDLITQDWFEYLLKYKSNHDEPPTGLNEDSNTRDLHAIRLRLDQYIQTLALRTPRPENIDARLMLEFYTMSNPSFDQIKKTSPNESKLSSFYRMEAEHTLSMAEGHLASIGGFIQPTGNLSLIGTRPSFGFMIGGKKSHSSFDLVVDFRFGPSSNDYTIQFKDTLVKVHAYTGVYACLEYGYEIFSKNKISIAISSGIGYETITALSSNNSYGEESKSLPTLNVSGGLVFKYFFRMNKYFGIQTRYNFVDFSNDGGTDMSGDYFSLRLVLGSTTTPTKHRRLKHLGVTTSGSE